MGEKIQRHGGTKKAARNKTLIVRFDATEALSLSLKLTTPPAVRLKPQSVLLGTNAIDYLVI